MNNVDVLKPFRPFNTIKRVAGYARVSTSDEHQDSSFRLQMTELENDIRSNPNYQFIGIFKDKKSGTSTKHRSEFNTMIELARIGELDIIYTKSITRFARNILDTIRIVRELKLLNVEVIFQKENISSLDPQTEFVLSVLAMQAEEESKNISDNTKWSVKRKIHSGLNLTSSLYGYKIDGEKWTIVESEAKVIRMIFDMYLKKVSYKKICERLFKLGIKTSTGKEKWHPGTIEGIVQNEKFAGHMALGKTYIFNGNTLRTKRVNHQEHFIKNHHDAIVSSSVYFAAIRLRESRTRNQLKTYIPLSERVTPYYRFVYSKLNNQYLRYVVERPKVKYEIPTLFCYDTQKKHRVMITVSNLFLILNHAIQNTKDVITKVSTDVSKFIGEKLNSINESLLTTEINSVELLTEKIIFLQSKRDLSSFIRKFKNTAMLSSVEDFRIIIQKVIIDENYRFSIKLNLIGNHDTNIEIIRSTINLKIGSANKDVHYIVYA